jgi:hypothetical protein
MAGQVVHGVNISHKISSSAEGEVANYNSDTPDRELVFKVTKDHFDSMAKAANSLLIAHGSGLFGCAAYLREPKPSSLYGGAGIGLYIFLFGLGFVFGVSGYGLTLLVRQNALGELIGAPVMRPRFAKFGYNAAFGFLLFSVLQLVAGVWGLIFTAFTL